MNRKLVVTVIVSIGALALAGLAFASQYGGSTSKAEFSDSRGGAIQTEPPPSVPSAPDPEQVPPSSPAPVLEGQRFLYSASDIAVYQMRMSKPGPYFSTGDAGHGGAYSPNDGQRSLRLASEFLKNPQESYWIQPDLPYSSGDAWPSSSVYTKPMHAAWVYMTVPTHPNRDDLRLELKDLLLHHATDSSHDYSDAAIYPVDFPGFAPSPVFGTSHWMTRLIKARDMLGRESFTADENAILDEWFYGYANWTFKWLHLEQYVNKLPGREQRDYSQIEVPADASRRSYDDGPLIGSLAMNYTNRQAGVASTASLAANYLKHFEYSSPSSGDPGYGQFSVDELLDHSRLYVEETIRFSVYPQGVQSDFERGDLSYHSTASAQSGWEYAANVLANVVEMADYHARRGDMSVWEYGTTAGFDGTEGVPVAGDFEQRNLHFFAWSMSRYVNNDWARTNFGEPLVLPHMIRDVLPAATASRFVPDDALLRDAWRRSGSNFPPYPQRPGSQGIWNAHNGEGAKHLGLIEHGGLDPISDN